MFLHKGVYGDCIIYIIEGLGKNAVVCFNIEVPPLSNVVVVVFLNTGLCNVTKL